MPPPLLAPVKQAAQSETGGEVALQKKGKKRTKRENSSKPDWDSDKVGALKNDKQKMKRMLIGSGLLFSLIVVGIIVALSGGQAPESARELRPAQPASSLSPQEAAPPKRSHASLVAECQPLAQSFLEAKTVEEMLPLVQNPEIAEPRMRRYYPGGMIEPQGLKDFNLGQAMQTKGKAISVVVRNLDFEAKTLVFIDGPQGLKINWESFVGWSDMPWADFIARKPTVAQAFRVIVAPVDYYNFSFADDRKWQSYSLQSPDKVHVIYGYVTRESALNFQVKLNPDVKSAPMILGLKFPDGATTANQVIIDSWIADGWIEEDLGP